MKQANEEIIVLAGRGPRAVLRAALLVLVVLTAALAACGGPAEPASAPTPVRVRASWQGPPVAPINANGVVAAHEEMRLAFKVGGIVSRIAVQPGQQVQRGQLLASIDPTEIDAQVAEAEEVADKAERDLARGERLRADEVISQEQLQNLRTQAGVARAALAAARFNRRHATIVAPDAGTVLTKLVEERELVPAGQPVLALGATASGFVIRTALADRDVVALRLGDAARVALDAFPGRKLDATVSQIAGAADPATGLFPVEVRLAEAPAGLASGMVAKLSLEPQRGDGAPLVYVPILAVVEGEGHKAFVYVVHDGRAEKRPIEVAFINDDSVALRSGLAAGTAVITEGALFLRDAEPVRVIADDRA